MMVLDICNCNTGTSTSQIRFVTGFFYKFSSQEIGTDWSFQKCELKDFNFDYFDLVLVLTEGTEKKWRSGCIC